MKKALSLALALLVAVPAARAAHPSAERDIVVASWNIENLFDAEDDPDNPGDDELTP